jgi:hypothetical protein
MRRISIVTDNDLIHALQNLEYQAIIERHDNQFSMIPMIRKYFLNQIRVKFGEECPDLLNPSTNLENSILNQYQFIPGRMLNYLIQELSFARITQEQLQNVLTRLQNPDNTHPLTGYFIDNLECLLSNMSTRS